MKDRSVYVGILKDSSDFGSKPDAVGPFNKIMSS